MEGVYGKIRALTARGDTAGALALLGLLVPILSSADALFAAATADLRRFIREHLTESLWKWMMRRPRLPEQRVRCMGLMIPEASWFHGTMAAN